MEENNALKKQNQSEKSEAKSASELDDQQDSGDTVVETASSRDRLHLAFDGGTTRGRFGVQHGNHNFAKRVYDKIRQIFHFQQPKSVGESTSTKRKFSIFNAFQCASIFYFQFFNAC